ncbi:MAG: zinc ABC transporter substrate-binding protein, partial [Solirubrobacterales bacterium]|nr:zinc ABC transporter substrate-binding protein [Solirubrobacterales bacterium]
KLAALAAVVAALALATGCMGTPMEARAGGIAIVAAENFWGSIAAQLAGSRAAVVSIIRNPARDPHSYEPTAADARTLASARLAIVNGVGYDPWASQLIAANPTPGRVVLNVGTVVGASAGDNPHRWYDPADVEKVANAITADLVRLDPKHALYFDRRRATFENTDLAAYHALIAAIGARYAGVPVGASESIFALQAPSLRLRLITPYSFMKAVSEGTELTASDVATAERQVAERQIKVWIYNAQNSTPEVERLAALARAHGIPVVTITETLSPVSDSFERWQVAQLKRIEAALHRATGR